MRGIFLGLGSNSGERLEFLRKSVAALETAGIRVVAISKVYEAEPFLGEWQDATQVRQGYLNAAIDVETDVSARKLLDIISDVECRLGRIRREEDERWGDRVIDIDLLMYGREVLGWEDGKPGDTLREIVVPHSRLHERNFVLVPCVQIAPDVAHPVFGLTFAELLGRSRDVHRVSVSSMQW